MPRLKSGKVNFGMKTKTILFVIVINIGESREFVNTTASQQLFGTRTRAFNFHNTLFWIVMRGNIIQGQQSTRYFNDTILTTPREYNRIYIRQKNNIQSKTMLHWRFTQGSICREQQNKYTFLLQNLQIKLSIFKFTHAHARETELCVFNKKINLKLDACLYQTLCSDDAFHKCTT